MHPNQNQNIRNALAPIPLERDQRQARELADGKGMLGGQRETPYGRLKRLLEEDEGFDISTITFSSKQIFRLMRRDLYSERETAMKITFLRRYGYSLSFSSDLDPAAAVKTLEEMIAEYKRVKEESAEEAVVSLLEEIRNNITQTGRAVVEEGAPAYAERREGILSLRKYRHYLGNSFNVLSTSIFILPNTAQTGELKDRIKRGIAGFNQLSAILATLDSRVGRFTPEEIAQLRADLKYRFEAVRAAVAELLSVARSSEEIARLMREDRRLRTFRILNDFITDIPSDLVGNIDRFVEATEAGVSEGLAKKNYRFVVQAERGGLPKLNITPEEFRNILQNLVHNAIDALPAGREGVITIILRAETDAQGRTWVVLRVEDNGTGMPAEVKARIFEPNFTSGEDKVHGGTGIGLTDVRKIVEVDHQGVIIVDTKEGEGTAFTIKLPAAEEAASGNTTGWGGGWFSRQLDEVDRLIVAGNSTEARNLLGQIQSSMQRLQQAGIDQFEEEHPGIAPEEDPLGDLNYALPRSRQLAQQFAQGGTSTDAPTAGKGGIDLRSLPIVAQPVSGSDPLLRSVAPPVTVPSKDLDQEWLQIQNMLKIGAIPSSDRLKTYLVSCCQKSGAEAGINKVISCIAQILRMEEERVVPTDQALRKLLTLLETGKPAKEIPLALAKISTLPKEFKRKP